MTFDKHTIWINEHTNEVWEFLDHWHFKGIHKISRFNGLDQDHEMKYYYPIECSEKCIQIQ